ncbi:MAG: glycosyltransferase family 39 protein [Candidatus Solibacter sp.]|nr:glycosyltransferase family 39 protein [Candidatus Solibacter sp.]
MRRALCAVALLALACLLVRAARVGLAGDYIDAISKITAQDEALYAHSAIAMARDGDWLTPRFMGRYALYKPPLLVWTAAVSSRLLGVSRLSLRLPIAIFSALSLGLLFLWGGELAGWQAGAVAGALLLSNHMWHTLAGLCMTDGLLLAFYIAAFYALFWDPWLESRAALFGFSGAVAAAILTKGIAGTLPLAVLGLYWLAARRQERPTFLRVCLAAALALVFAAPWFIYQFTVHPQWFWTEHIAVEILGFGAGAPPQTSHENQAVFYLMRLAITDPLLLAAAAVAIPAFLLDLRRRTAAPVLLAAWIAVMLAAALGWQYRNAAYLLPLVPAMALLAAVWGPFRTRRYAPWMWVVLAGAFLIKTSAPELPWGLDYRAGTVQPTAPILSAYCGQARGNELIVLDAADDLYAAALPLARLRYATIAPVAAPAGPYSMPFAEMGITVTVDQFNDLARYAPAFRARLRGWGLDSGAPVATLITARTVADLTALVRAHPESDFLIPAIYRKAVESAPQELVGAAAGYLLLLSRAPLGRTSPPAWSCRM